MSRNGSSKGTENSNGTSKKVWDLRNDGILWKQVVAYSPQSVQKLATSFVAQLQDSAQPSDALQGLLVDRIAASYLRKQLLLEMEAAKRFADSGTSEKSSKRSESAAEVQKTSSIVTLQTVPPLSSPEFFRYEALLDQGFHRDMILLQKLKEMHPVPEPGDRKAVKSEAGIIDGASIISQL